jgi:hypothetical protein
LLDDFMRKRFSPPKLAAAATVALLCLPVVGHAQTTQTGATTPASASTDKQAQKNPVAPTQSDGKSGQSARPWPTDSTSTSDPGLIHPPQ